MTIHAARYVMQNAFAHRKLWKRMPPSIPRQQASTLDFGVSAANGLYVPKCKGRSYLPGKDDLTIHNRRNLQTGKRRIHRVAFLSTCTIDVPNYKDFLIISYFCHTSVAS